MGTRTLTRRQLLGKAAILGVGAALGLPLIKPAFALNPSTASGELPVWYMKGQWTFVFDNGGWVNQADALCEAQMFAQQLSNQYPNGFWSDDPANNGEYSDVRSNICVGKPWSDKRITQNSISTFQGASGKYYAKVIARTIQFLRMPDGSAGNPLPAAADTFNELFDVQ